jgi:hypothetical protein
MIDRRGGARPMTVCNPGLLRDDVYQCKRSQSDGGTGGKAATAQMTGLFIRISRPACRHLTPGEIIPKHL